MPVLVLMLNAELGGTMMLAGLLLPALLILGTLPLATAFNQRRLLPREFFLLAYVVHLLGGAWPLYSDFFSDFNIGH